MGIENTNMRPSGRFTGEILYYEGIERDLADVSQLIELDRQALPPTEIIQLPSGDIPNSVKLGKQIVAAYSQDDDERSWQDQANCLGVDPDLFFPERGASVKAAKEVCRGCDVRIDCLEFALVRGEKFGIWGGLSERERRRIRSQRAQSRRPTTES